MVHANLRLEIKCRLNIHLAHVNSRYENQRMLSKFIAAQSNRIIQCTYDLGDKFASQRTLTTGFQQYLGRFLDIFGRDLGVSKTTWLYVDTFGFPPLVVGAFSLFLYAIWCQLCWLFVSKRKIKIVKESSIFLQWIEKYCLI